MPDDDRLGYSVTQGDDLGGWSAEPVDHDPFAEGSAGNRNRDFGYPGENPAPSPQGFAGHVAASPTPDQKYTPKYLAARPQGSIASYDPSLSEGIQQGVSEQAQRWGVPVTGAERMGSTARTVAESAPISGNILAGDEAARSWQSGDPWGTLLHGAMALPIPGASTEEAAARRISPLGFYSHGADVAANLPQKVGTTQQMVAQLQKAGVKPVEMQAAGVQKLGETAPTLFQEKTRAEDLEQMFHQASPQLQETVLGEHGTQGTRQQIGEVTSQLRLAEQNQDWDQVETLEAQLGDLNGLLRRNPTKFGDWVLPGPHDNYREVLLHTPEQGRQQAYTLGYRGGPQFGGNFATHEEALDHLNDVFPNRQDIEARPTTANDVRDTTMAAPGQNFTESHWDTPNVVAHLRFSDRRGVPTDDAAEATARQFSSRLGEDFDSVSPKQQQHYINAARESAPADSHLHLEELQSDWGQKGRDEGFTRPLTPEEQELQAMYQKDSSERPTYDWHRAVELEKAGVGQSLKEATAGKHPIGPYVTNTNDWTDLGLKRALVEAARGDYTHLSWATGTAQADRYKLSHHISDLSYNPEIGSLQARSVGGGRALDERNVKPEDLPGHVGREVAEKLLAEPQGPHFSAVDEPRRNTAAWQRDGWHTLSGEDVNVGGQGMRSYYDPVVTDNYGKPMLNKDGSPKVGVLPTQLSKLVKKLDPSVKIGSSQIQGKFPGRYRARPAPDGRGYRVEDMNGNVLSEFMTPGAADARIRELTKNTVHSIPITPLMREKILKGMPQYRHGGRIGFADGGTPEDPLGSSVTYAHPSLEPVDHDPFPPEPQVQESDINRAKGFPEPRSPMHDRLAAASQDVPYTPEDIDQPGPMTETLAHYAGNPEHAMPMRIGAAVGEEAKRMGQGLWNAATVPGDVASGKASMADPETQERVMGLAASLPGGGPEAALGARGPVGAAAKAVKRAAPAERELNVWNPTTGQWEGPKPKMNPPEGVTYPPLFNLDPEVMNRVPDVPQFELQRYNPPRGVSERMRDLVTNPDVRQQMIQIVRNGMQTVGLSWYNTGQLRSMFLKELGETEGQQAFEKYMNLVSATSPENKIPQNIRTASHFYEREAQGMPPPERGDPIAQPYGSKAQKLHQQNVKSVLTEGYDVLKNPKPPSFVQNLMGNYAPGTMDRHAFKLPAMLSRDPRFLETSFTPEKGAAPVRPQEMHRNGQLTVDDAVNQPTMWAGMPNKNEYAALEGYYKSIADELGITPAQVQASAWVGGGHVTGLASAADETFLHSFQGRVFNTAHHTGQTPAEVVRRMIRGEQPLLAGGPGMAPLLPQDRAQKEAQTSTAGAGASPPPPSDQELREHPFY